MNRTKAPKIDFINKLKTRDVETEQLKNGVKLYFIKSTNTEISEIIWHFNSGVWDQEELLVATLTAKMVTEGTKFLTSQQIADVFDLHGAHFTKSVAMHSTSFKLMALNKYLPKLVNTVSQILSQPLFDNNEFNVIRNETKQKFLIDLEEAETIARFTIEKNIYGHQHPYGWIASPDDYDKLNTTWIKKYFDKNYTSKNLSIIIVTNNKQAVKNSLTKEFENFNNSNKIIIKRNFTIEPLLQTQYIEKKSSLQSAIRVGWRTFERNNSDYCDMMILDTLLGGYFGSRLMQNIRQKLGLTYSIYSSLTALKFDGTFQIISEVNKENKQKVLDEIIKEVNEIKTNFVSEAEILKLKNYLLGALLRSIDGNFNFASVLSYFLTYDTDFNFYSIFVDKVKNISPDKIQFLAKKYLDINKMYSVIVG